MGHLLYGIVGDFLSAAACDKLCDVTAPYLKPARVFQGGELKVDPARRADSFTCPPNTGPAVQQVAAAIDQVLRRFTADLPGAPPFDDQHAEDFQFVRYGVGGGYDGHFDWHSAKTLARPGQLGGQRTWTAMMYLRAPESGGETTFPLLGLSFKPQPGLMLVWNNLDEKGEPNPWAWHEAKSVTAGEKWIVTRWYHEKPVRD